MAIIPAPITVENIAVAPAQVPFLRRPGMLERFFGGTMIFVFAFSLPNEWFIQVGQSSAGTVQGGSPLVTLVFLGFFGVAALAFVGNWKIVMAAAAREPLIPALMVLITLSTLWSVNLIETFSAAVVIGITMMIGYYFAIRFRLEETLFMAGVAFAVGLVLSYIWIFAFPNLGLDRINVVGGENPRWSGIFITKNELGRIAALSFIVFVFLARIRRSFFVWPLLAALAMLQVVASASATSFGALGGIIGLTVVFLGFRGRKTLYGAVTVAMASVFGILTLIAATNLGAASGILGRNATFTGRLPLWVDSWNIGINQRLWTGYGWLAYWTENESFPVRVRANFVVPHAHNAFLDAWLYAGPIAAALLLAIYVRGLIWGARNIRAIPTAVGLAPIILISYSLIFSLTEAGVVRRDISFVLFVVAVVTAAKNKGRTRPFGSLDAEKVRANTS